MKIIQIGEAKSGNFWLYKILQNIISRSGLDDRSYVKSQPIHAAARSWDLSYQDQADIDVLDIEARQYFYRISSIFRMPIENIDDYVGQTSHIWSHSAYCGGSKKVFDQLDKIIYLIRDPRDRAISAAKFRYTPYGLKFYSPAEPDPDTWLDNRFQRLINRWVNHVGGYLEHAHEYPIHFIYYERLLHSFDQELSDLLEYLELDLNGKEKEEIKEQVQFSSMKAENPGHVRRGKSGAWEESLSAKQKRIAIRYAGPLIKYLGYPVKETNGDPDLPQLPPQINPSFIRKAVRHSAIKLAIHKMANFLTN